MGSPSFRSRQQSTSIGRRCRQADEGQRDAADIAPVPLPSFFALSNHSRPLPWREALATLPAERPLVPILLYRSGVAAGDTAMQIVMQVLLMAVLMPVITGAMYFAWKQMLGDAASSPASPADQLQA